MLYRVETSDRGVTARTVAASVVHSTPGSDLLVSIVPVNGWRSALPGAANHDHFGAWATPSSPSWLAWWAERSPYGSGGAESGEKPGKLKPEACK